jgi:PPOX class probable F420-dependent enzyme
MGSCASVSELPAWTRRLLAEGRVARLGLLDASGAPRVLPVTYALSGSALVSAVDHKPKRVTADRLARVRWLRADPRATLTVDRYDEDWSRLAWVQVLGSVRLLAPADAPDETRALIDRYPQYARRPPAGPLLVLEPRRLLWWSASEPA